MKRKIEEKLKAIALRKRGYSVNEITERVGVAKSSVSIWVRNVPLNEAARARLLTQVKKGQLAGAEAQRRKTKSALDNHFKKAFTDFNGYDFGSISERALCAMIYWCEGAKDQYSPVKFTNSDPELVKCFLGLLRKNFEINEDKFRACIHLHGYHDARKQISFWSTVTKIPEKQFVKPYRKPNTGKRIRENYPGCIAITYLKTDLTRELLMTAKAFFKGMGA